MKKFLSRKKKQQDAHVPAQQAGSDPTLPTNVNPSQLWSLPDLSFPDGVKVLHDCSDATVDICFVHGLTGDRESTWTARGQSLPWPQTLLPPTLSKARILTYGYDAYVVRKGVAGSSRLIDHATNLLHDLTSDRAGCNASSRPLIFVAHSLGGLVCKMAILRSRNNPDVHLRGIFQSVTGVIFMGTPHKGAWMADWAKIPVSALARVKSANVMLLDILQRDNQLLESLHVDFSGMIRELHNAGRSLEITCFFEELPLPVFGKVVSKDSASFEGHDPITVHADHRDMVRFVSAEENGFKRVLGELTRWKSQINSPQDHLGCLKSLAFPTMHDRSHDIDPAAKGTCEWLQQHEKYKSWAACDRGLLWIKGKPGSGKSTLLKYVLHNHVPAFKARSSDLVLSFFFHDRGDELQKTPLGFFRSLLHQLLSQVPAALSNLVEEFRRKCQQIGEPGQKWHWHEKELWHFFELSLPKVLETHLVWLFVDALDECGEENAQNLIQKFKSLLETPQPQSIRVNPFHLCFACRPYPVPDCDGGLEIHPEDFNEDDISAFVKGRFSSSRLKTSEIPGLITSHAAGVFMWARLVVKQVLDIERTGAKPRDMKEAIEKVPHALDELYERLIESMPAESVRLIQWICFAARPLTTDELRWAIAIEPDCPYRSLQAFQSAGDVPDTDGMERHVQTLSRGLAEVTRSSGTQVVQFIHQSVKDFFMEKGLLTLVDNSTTLDMAIGISHFQLSTICLRYLAMEEIAQAVGSERDDTDSGNSDTESGNSDTDSGNSDTDSGNSDTDSGNSDTDTEPGRENLKSDFPFLKYATIEWLEHTKQSNAKGIPQEDLVDLLEWPSNAFLERWVRTFKTLYPFSLSEPTKATSLAHLASKHACLGLLQAIVHRILEGTGTIDSKDAYGRTPLSYAAYTPQNEAAVRLLLETGRVEPDSRTNHGRTPLGYAASTPQNEAAVRLLLETGRVEPDSRDGYGRTPLSYAASTPQSEATVRLLLGTGQVEPDSRDNYGMTPLMHAIYHGNGAVANLLLATGRVGFDSRDNEGRTPFWYAALGNRPALVKLLLATGQIKADSIRLALDDVIIAFSKGRSRQGMVELLKLHS